jgi:hypothetical protein
MERKGGEERVVEGGERGKGGRGVREGGDGRVRREVEGENGRRWR